MTQPAPRSPAGEQPGLLPIRSSCRPAAPSSSAWTGYARITARCSDDNVHSYALYVRFGSERVASAGYTRGLGKFRVRQVNPEVDFAMDALCLALEGRPVDTIADLGLAEVLRALQLDPASVARALAVSGAQEPTNMGVPQRERLRQEMGESAFAAYMGGGLAHILVQLSVVNHRIKQAVSEVLQSSPNAVVHWSSLQQVSAVVERLLQIPALGDRRAIDLGVRSMQFHRVDESSFRSAYQRWLFPRLARQAAAAGFGFDGQFQLIGGA